MEDSGIGSNFLLFNRRVESPLFGKCPLLNYRWNGILLKKAFGLNQFEAGMSENELNRFLEEIGYTIKAGNNNLHISAEFIGEDSYWSSPVYAGGAEARLIIEPVQFHSAFEYNYLPGNYIHSVKQSWNCINEVRTSPLPKLNIILTSVDKKTYAQAKASAIYDVCFDLTHVDFNAFAGVNTQQLLGSRTWDFYLDGNLHLTSTLSVGAFFDYILSSESHDYVKLGLQSHFELH